MFCNKYRNNLFISLDKSTAFIDDILFLCKIHHLCQIFNSQKRLNYKNFRGSTKTTSVTVRSFVVL